VIKKSSILFAASGIFALTAITLGTIACFAINAISFTHAALVFAGSALISLLFGAMFATLLEGDK